MCQHTKKNWEKFLEAILMIISEYRAQCIFNVISIGVDIAYDSIKSELKDELHKVTLTIFDTNCYVKVTGRKI